MPIKPVSTVGAGDSFLGALVARLAMGRDMEDAFRDLQYRARAAMVRVRDAELGEAVVQNVVPKFSQTPGSVDFLGAPMGAHNEEVYCGELGYSPARLAQLREEGII